MGGVTRRRGVAFFVPVAVAAATPVVRVETVGRSAAGRPIVAAELGARGRPVTLVVGCIHGDECAGTRIVRRLLTAGCAPTRGDLWLVPNLNPDGAARGTRQNGRGVDLNRNFPSEWKPRGRRWDPEYSGPRPSSEPETRAAERLVRRLRPRVTVWYHQPTTLVRAWGPSVRAGAAFARAVGLPFRRLRWPAGTAPNWQNHRFPGTASFVVELPPGPLGARAVARHAAALLRLAGSGPPRCRRP